MSNSSLLRFAVLLPRLVDVLERLERKDGRHTSRVLPFQTSSTSRLSSKQQEAVLLGQRLAFADQLDEVALLGVGEFVDPSLMVRI